MRRKSNKSKKAIARKTVRLLGAAAAVVPMVLSVPAITSANPVEDVGPSSLNDLVRYYQQHPGQSIENYRDLLWNAVLSSTTPGNHAPTTSPHAVPLGMLPYAHQTFDLNDYFSDPDEDELTYQLLTPLPSGSFASACIEGSDLEITSYFSGNIKIRATDSHGARVTQTFEVTVGSGEENPPVNHAPVANAVNFETKVGTAYSGYLDGYDEDEDSLSYNIVSNPSHGTIVLSDPDTGAFTYTPSNDWYGTDTFRYDVNDGSGPSEEAIVTITVNQADGPLTLHTIGQQVIDDEEIYYELNLQAGQTADIDLSQMFEYEDEGGVTYSASYVGFSLSENELEGNYLSFAAGASTGYTTVTISASDGLHNLSEKLRVYVGHNDNGIQDVHSVSTTNVGLQLDNHFDASTIPVFSAEMIEGPDGTSVGVENSALSLSLLPDSISTFRVQAAYVHGLTISDNFTAYAGMPVIDIGTQYSDYYNGRYNVSLYLDDIFPNATQFEFQYEEADLDVVTEDGYLMISSEGSYVGDVTIVGKDASGQITASYVLHVVMVGPA